MLLRIANVMENEHIINLVPYRKYKIYYKQLCSIEDKPTTLYKEMTGKYITSNETGVILYDDNDNRFCLNDFSVLDIVEL